MTIAHEKEWLIDLSNQEQRWRLISHLQTLRGMHRIEILRHRPRRTDRQNRYYWPGFVTPFASWLTEQYGEEVSADEAHEHLKGVFNSRELMDRQTGIKTKFVQSTTKLSTVEFNQYLDRCAQFLADFCGIVVPEPNVYHEVD